jgi:hypothetical protein
MQKTYRDILSEILQIIHYRDKEKFITEFENLNYLDTMANILPMLSGEVREFIKINHADPEKIKQYIPQELYLQELIKVSADALNRFIEDIRPTLNGAQKESLANLLSTYQ